MLIDSTVTFFFFFFSTNANDEIFLLTSVIMLQSHLTFLDTKSLKVNCCALSAPMFYFCAINENEARYLSDRLCQMILTYYLSKSDKGLLMLKYFF